jgi:hypothetical protein
MQWWRIQAWRPAILDMIMTNFRQLSPPFSPCWLREESATTEDDMKIGLLLCCLAAGGFTGCMSTHELWGDSPADVSAGLKRLQGEEVDITLTNGSLYADVIFNAFGDSVTFRSEKAAMPTVVPLTAVASVSKSGSALGPILGCLGGLIIGGTIGSSMALREHTSVKQTNVAEEFGAALTAPLAVAAGGMTGGLIGGTAGLIIGSLLGSGDRFILDPGPDSGNLNEKGERCIAVAVTASGDSIILGVAGLIARLPGKITVLWHGERIGLARPPAEVVRRGRSIQVIAPENAWQ